MRTHLGQMTSCTVSPKPNCRYHFLLLLLRLQLPRARQQRGACHLRASWQASPLYLARPRLPIQRACTYSCRDLLLLWQMPA